MDDNQQETIAKLKFLGRVNKGEKINVKEMTLQTESYITSMSRSVWFVDNRNNTLSFINTSFFKYIFIFTLYIFFHIFLFFK